MARTSTMATAAPFPRRSVLCVDQSERVLVLRCAGAGPYTLTVRRINWFDRLRWRLHALLRRMAAPISKRMKAWRLSRCDEDRCWRRAEPDVEFNFYCRRHGGMARSADEAI